MENGQLQVHYKNDKERIVDELDKAIKKALRLLGYRLYGTGYKVKTGVRGMAFRKEVKN